MIGEQDLAPRESGGGKKNGNRGHADARLRIEFRAHKIKAELGNSTNEYDLKFPLFMRKETIKK